MPDGVPGSQVDVRLQDLPAGLHGFTILQISDIHVGPTIKRGFRRIVDQVNSLESDLIAITGDLVDSSVPSTACQTAGCRPGHGSFSSPATTSTTPVRQHG